jgi:hypothetical protein
VYSVANALTREPTLLITENIGERPQEQMIRRKKSRELRHRIK